jgi:hypothetical protein
VNYLESLAREIQQAVPDDALPNEDTSALFLMYAVVLLARGEDTGREDVHNAWVAWMTTKGEQHESMVPFAELPLETQAEDSPFVIAIRTVARRTT